MRPDSSELTEDGGSFAARAQKLYASDLHWFLVGRLKSDQDARDVMQEVYLRLLRLGKGELIREPRAYVYFVARQVLAQFRLRAATGPVTYDSELAQHWERHPSDYARDQVVDRVQALDQLEHLLQSLPSLHSKVFVLRTFEGLSWAQIAERLEISKHTVKKYLYEASARIALLRREQRD